MKKVVVAFMALAILVSCNNKSEQSTMTNNIKKTEKMEKLAKQEIQQLLEAYKVTLNTSNASEAAALYTKEGVFMPTQAPTAIGQEQLKASYEFIFTQIQLNVEFYIEEIQVEGNLAFATTSSKGTTLIHANSVTVPEENRELFVFEKENGTWKIARYMFNKTK